MFHLVTGGSGSGKSEYAEKLLTKSGKQKSPYLYIAAMQPFGEEAQKKMERHHKLRWGKGFETIERYRDLKSLLLPENAGVLVECVSNLAANEMFCEDGFLQDEENVKKAVLEGIRQIALQTENLVVVTNEVGLDVQDYSEETKQYIALLGKVNASLSQMADTVTEVVYGIPVTLK